MNWTVLYCVVYDLNDFPVCVWLLHELVWYAYDWSNDCARVLEWFACGCAIICHLEWCWHSLSKGFACVCMVLNVFVVFVYYLCISLHDFALLFYKHVQYVSYDFQWLCMTVCKIAHYVVYDSNCYIMLCCVCIFEYVWSLVKLLCVWFVGSFCMCRLCLIVNCC